MHLSDWGCDTFSSKCIFLILRHSSTYSDDICRTYNCNMSRCVDECVICTSKPSAMLQRRICSFLGDNLVGPNTPEIDLLKTRDGHVILAHYVAMNTTQYTDSISKTQFTSNSVLLAEQELLPRLH